MHVQNICCVGSIDEYSNSIDTKDRPFHNTEIWQIRLSATVSTHKLVAIHSKTFLFYNTNCKFLLQAHGHSASISSLCGQNYEQQHAKNMFRLTLQLESLCS